jgi:hypothetical protein
MFYPPSLTTDLERALYLVEQTILAGLIHGHFELSVRSELVKNGDRQLIVTSGNSYRFKVDPEDLKKSR